MNLIQDQEKMECKKRNREGMTQITIWKKRETREETHGQLIVGIPHLVLIEGETKIAGIGQIDKDLSSLNVYRGKLLSLEDV
jgi:hypothetical protein